VVGLLTMLLHSWFYLGLFTRRNILGESFHDNHPAAPASLLGLMGGMLLLNHGLLQQLPPGVHLFQVPEHWGLLLMALVSVFLVRALMSLGFRALLGVNLRHEAVRDNAAWGVLDGALIFVLTLVLQALIV